MQIALVRAATETERFAYFAYNLKTLYREWKLRDWKRFFALGDVWCLTMAKMGSGETMALLSFRVLWSIEGTLILEILTLQSNNRRASTILRREVRGLGQILLCTAIDLVRTNSTDGIIYAQCIAEGYVGGWWDRSVMTTTNEARILLLQTGLLGWQMCYDCLPRSFDVHA